MAGELRWLFTKEELVNTPSRKAGIDAEKELNYRQQCANLIQDMGQKLQVTQLCINTAIVYMHRFYMFHSFTKFHRNPMGAACLFLAAKVEEQPRKLEHVIRAYHFCVNRDQGSLDVKSEAYLELAQECVVNENILLQTLGFSISVEHPHAHVVKTCTLVKASKDLAQTSYFLATNSLHLTTMCLKYSHTVVACVCIHLACKWSNYQIPRSTEGKEWYEYVDKKISKEMLENLTQEFLKILDNCPSKLKKKILTWKSGGKSLEDQNNPGGGGSNHSEVTHSPLHQARHPQQSTSKAPDQELKHSASSSSSDGLRRVRTEPTLTHKDYVERKQREQQQQRGRPHPHQQPHSKHPSGYHAGQQGGAPSGGPGGPTHPPPGARPTHPPPSRRPGGSQPSHPHHRSGEGEHKGHHASSSSTQGSHHHHHHHGGNIFEAMQQRPSAATGSEGNSSSGAPSSQGHHHHRVPPQPHGARPHATEVHAGHGPSQHSASSHRNQGRPGDSSSANIQGHSSSSSQGHPPSSSTSASHTVQDKINQVLGRSAPIKTEKDKAPIEQKPQNVAQPKAQFSRVNQDNLEKMMMEKLQSEILKGKSKDPSLAHKRQSPEKAGPLRSPPPIKRQKSSSGSDSTTPKKEDREKKIQEIKDKMQQEDQKRLRRLSEDLGDGRLLEKPIVVLDNVFTSPQSAMASTDKALLSPGATAPKIEASLGGAPNKETMPAQRTHVDPSAAKSASSAHSSTAHAQQQKSHVRKSLDPAMAKGQHMAHHVKREGGQHHQQQHANAEAAKLAAAHRQHRKEHSDPTKRNPHEIKKEHPAATSKEIKKEPVDSHRLHSKDIKSEFPNKEVKKEASDRGYASRNIKAEPESGVKTDVSEILKTIGRKEDFLRIGPPREIIKKEPQPDISDAGKSSDTSTSQSATTAAASQGGATDSKDAAPSGGMVRNKSTISLANYRQRRPQTPSQPNPPQTPDKGIGALPSQLGESSDLHSAALVDDLMKDVLGESSSSSAAVSAAATKNSSKINAAMNVVKDNSTRNVIKESVRNAAATRKEAKRSGGGEKESSNGVNRDQSFSKGAAQNALPHNTDSVIARTPHLAGEFPINSPGKVADAKMLMGSKMDKLDKLTARIERPPMRATQAAATPDAQMGKTPQVSQPAAPMQQPKIKAPIPNPTSVPTGLMKPAEPASPSVEPGEIIDDGPADSPVRKEKVGLKIKIGGQNMVVTSMSPHTGDASQTTSHQSREHHHHHHKDKHKHKHKHKHKNKDRDKDKERRHHRDKGESGESSSRHRSPAAALGDSGSSSDLKIKIRNLGGGARSGDSLLVANDNSTVAGGDITGEGSSQPAAAPMKLVLSKDKSGQYSSGHKHKHSSGGSSSSRKRTHSPVDNDRLSTGGSAPPKIPRSADHVGTPPPNGSGSKPGSPHERLEMTRKSSESLERILHNQRRMMGKFKGDHGKGGGKGSSKNKSPVRLPAGYQNPNTDL